MSDLQKMFDESNPRQFLKMSEETRAKKSAARKGKPGKKHSEETRAKISDAHKGKKREDGWKWSKPVMTPNGLYPSKKAVAEAANVSTVSVDKWIKKWPEHYFFLDKQHLD
jgi:hypothetical protein